MRTTNISDLKRATFTILKEVEQGETVQIMRGNQVIAILSPPPEATPEQIERPDFEARLKEIFGDRTLPSTGQDIVDYDRGER